MSQPPDCEAKGSCQAGCKEASQGLGWHLGHGASQAELTDAGVSYEEAVVIVDTINSGIELVMQDVKSTYTPVFAQVLKKQEKLSGEVGAVGKEVQAAKHSQAQAVQDVEYRFSQEFAKVFNNQVKLCDEMRELKYDVQAIKKNIEFIKKSSDDLPGRFEVGAIKRQVEATFTDMHDQEIKTWQKVHDVDIAVAKVAADVRIFGIAIVVLGLLRVIIANSSS